MNADVVQTEGKGSNENTIKNATPQTQSVKTVSPETSSNGGIGNSNKETESGTGEEGIAATKQKLQEMPDDEEV